MSNKIRNRKISLLLSALLALSLTAMAAAADTSTSDATVSFTKGDGDVAPVDPDNPKTDLEQPDEGDPTPGVADGDYTILYASTFRFEETKLTSNVSSTFPLDTDNRRPHVQVLDLRGTREGWTLSASVSKFTEVGAANDAHTLDGAAIKINDIRINSEADESIWPKPATLPINLTTDGQKTNIIVAEKGTGMGVYAGRFYPDDEDPEAIDPAVELYVPANVLQIGSYKATITWELGNAPS